MTTTIFNRWRIQSERCGDAEVDITVNMEQIETTAFGSAQITYEHGLFSMDRVDPAIARMRQRVREIRRHA